MPNQTEGNERGRDYRCSGRQRPPERRRRGGAESVLRLLPRVRPPCAGIPALRCAPREVAEPEAPVPEKDRAGDSRFHDTRGERGVVSIRGLPGAELSQNSGTCEAEMLTQPQRTKTTQERLKGIYGNSRCPNLAEQEAMFLQRSSGG
ncbi:hypothetical protein VULLAG_LOCUS3558 [Vulpes lagopus]